MYMTLALIIEFFINYNYLSETLAKLNIYSYHSPYHKFNNFNPFAEVKTNSPY